MVLVVDRHTTPSVLYLALTEADHQVLIAHDAASALRCVQASLPDAVLMHWRGATDAEELALMEQFLSTDGPPILVFSERAELADRLQALECGADDYLTIPCQPREVQARLQALLRRRPFVVASPALLRYQDLAVHLNLHKAFRGQRLLALTPREFTLLVCLLERPEEVVARSSLIRAVWGYTVHKTWNNLSVFVSCLRGKLEASGESRLIHTIRGIGYMLSDELVAQAVVDDGPPHAAAPALRRTTGVS